MLQTQIKDQSKNKMNALWYCENQFFNVLDVLSKPLKHDFLNFLLTVYVSILSMALGDQLSVLMYSFIIFAAQNLLIFTKITDLPPFPGSAITENGLERNNPES